MDEQAVLDLRNAERIMLALEERIASLEDLLREAIERIRILNAIGQG